jgi:hypothetical protein
MNFYDYQAKKLKVDKDNAADPTPTIPEIKVEELEARPEEIEVVEGPTSDTFIGRLDARIRKLWGKE